MAEGAVVVGRRGDRAAITLQGAVRQSHPVRVGVGFALRQECVDGGVREFGQVVTLEVPSPRAWAVPLVVHALQAQVGQLLHPLGQRRAEAGDQGHQLSALIRIAHPDEAQARHRPVP